MEWPRGGTSRSSGNPAQLTVSLWVRTEIQTMLLASFLGFPALTCYLSRTMTDMNLDGRVAIVTGATKGVGRGVGCELARYGARVFVTGRSAPRGFVGSGHTQTAKEARP